MQGQYQQSHAAFQLCGQLTIKNMLYLHFHKVYGLKTYQGGDLEWGGPTHKVTGLCGPVTSQKKFYLHFHKKQGPQI